MLTLVRTMEYKGVKFSKLMNNVSHVSLIRIL